MNTTWNEYYPTTESFYSIYRQLFHQMNKDHFLHTQENLLQGLEKCVNQGLLLDVRIDYKIQDHKKYYDWTNWKQASSLIQQKYSDLNVNTTDPIVVRHAAMLEFIESLHQYLQKISWF